MGKNQSVVSSFTSSLCKYERESVTKMPEEGTLVGKLRTHVVRRIAIPFGVALLLHAEAVSRVIYILFLKIKECFTQPNPDLLEKQKILAQVAYVASLYSFFSIFQKRFVYSLPQERPPQLSHLPPPPRQEVVTPEEPVVKKLPQLEVPPVVTEPFFVETPIALPEPELLPDNELPVEDQLLIEADLPLSPIPEDDGAESFEIVNLNSQPVVLDPKTS